MLWAGRGMPEKGPDVAVELAQQIGKPVKLFPVMRAESHAWFETHVGKKARKSPTLVTIGPALSRQELALEYPKSKLFLFPLSWDEPFGMVIVESLASGTPVIAYARGSTSDMIDDGKTGLLVDPSRGLAGLVKAVEHIYALSIAEYELMRKACRVYAEEQFSIHKTVQSYTKLYRSLSIS